MVRHGLVHVHCACTSFPTQEKLKFETGEADGYHGDFCMCNTADYLGFFFLSVTNKFWFFYIPGHARVNYVTCSKNPVS